MKKKKTYVADDYFNNRVSLYCPGEKEIAAAYEGLPGTGYAEISCSLNGLTSTLNHLESAGFFGISLFPSPDFARGLTLLAFKGKENPCYDTGKSAVYKGGALAVMDDDNHLLFGEMRLCEKTAVIYGLPGYKDLVDIKGGDQELMVRLNTDPVLFDCDTFERDINDLSKIIKQVESRSEYDAAVIYPGPFKFLILSDGTVIRRGLPTRISADDMERLKRSDSCLPLSGDLAASAVVPEDFSESFRDNGPAFLIDAPFIDVSIDVVGAVDFSVLREVSGGTRERLLKLIDSGSEYFIITGSDARDLNGCCPSDGVESSNRLVEAGILQVVRADAPPDACPTNIYAFRDEIRPGVSRPEFKINRKFRDEVGKYLSEKSDLKKK